VGYLRADIPGAHRMTWWTRMTRIPKSKRPAVPRPLGPRSVVAAVRIRVASTRQEHCQVLNTSILAERERARGGGGGGWGVMLLQVLQAAMANFGAHAKCTGAPHTGSMQSGRKRWVPATGLWGLVWAAGVSPTVAPEILA
jgi:hypothetical protein